MFILTHHSMPLDVCWCIKASRVDMSVQMLLQGIIVWQVYLWCRRYFRKEFVRSCDACQLLEGA